MALVAKKTNLVWSNLVHNKVRTFVGVIGIAFADILIFMQLGFLGSTEATATLIYQKMNFDLLLVSTDYIEFSRSGIFDLNRLARVRAAPEVTSAVPVHVGFPFWRKEPGPQDPFGKRQIMVIAFPPEAEVFLLPEVRAAQDHLKLPDTVLFDRRSREKFGVPDEPVAALAGKRYWVDRTPVQIVGTFALGSGFIADGLILTSAANYARLTGQQGTLNAAQLGLIKLKPGADATATADALNRRLGPGIHVWTRAAIESHEKYYWVAETALGIIFHCGVVVAVLVGIVFVYQVISSDIGSRLKEFATLKAIGYGDRYLSFTIIYQAVLLALFGYVPGLVVSFGLYALAASFAGIPIGLTGERPFVLVLRCGVVLLLTVGLCSVSGLLALGKLKAADPADLF